MEIDGSQRRNDNEDDPRETRRRVVRDVSENRGRRKWQLCLWRTGIITPSIYLHLTQPLSDEEIHVEEYHEHARASAVRGNARNAQCLKHSYHLFADRYITHDAEPPVPPAPPAPKQPSTPRCRMTPLSSNSKLEIVELHTTHSLNTRGTPPRIRTPPSPRHTAEEE